MEERGIVRVILRSSRACGLMVISVSWLATTFEMGRKGSLMRLIGNRHHLRVSNRERWWLAYARKIGRRVEPFVWSLDPRRRHFVDPPTSFLQLLASALDQVRFMK